MFVLIISRASSKMGHFGKKLGHQVKYKEILVYTIDATCATQFWWNFVRVFVLTISRTSSNMGHFGIQTRSPGQISGNYCLHSKRSHFQPDFDKTWTDCLYWQYPGQVWIWVRFVEKNRSPGQILGFFYTLEARFATQFWWNLLRMFVLTTSRPS